MTFEDGTQGSELRPPAELIERAAALLGSQPVTWRKAPGGFSIAERWTLQLEDGRRVFAKLATTDDIARRLRLEHRNMLAVPTDIRCAVVAWEEGSRPLLVVEDLSHAHWPPLWRPGDVELVMAGLERLWSTPTQGFFESAEADRRTFSGWSKVQANPDGFLSLGVASASWLDTYLPLIVEAERSVVLDGEDFLHLDIRGDNLCLLPDRVVFVDWNFACRGNRWIDLALWLPSLEMEGGPTPEEVAQVPGPYVAAWCGVLANGAHQPPPRGAPGVRDLQLRGLRVTLPWMCRALSIPEPESVRAD